MREGKRTPPAHVSGEGGKVTVEGGGKRFIQVSGKEEKNEKENFRSPLPGEGGGVRTCLSIAGGREKQKV